MAFLVASGGDMWRRIERRWLLPAGSCPCCFVPGVDRTVRRDVTARQPRMVGLRKHGAFNIIINPSPGESRKGLRLRLIRR